MAHVSWEKHWQTDELFGCITSAVMDDEVETKRQLCGRNDLHIEVIIAPSIQEISE